MSETASGAGPAFDRLQALVLAPSESLTVELKSWIDPSTPAGAEKVVRGVLSLYNRNGGHFLIGFDDKTLQPDPSPFADVPAQYRKDDLQALVSRHASSPVEIDVRFVERDGQFHPVVVVPSGVRTPVALSRNLGNARPGDVLFRTLLAGGVVSTSTARPGDWADILQICFDNRDADIGAFVRRHLSGIDLGALAALLRSPPPPPSLSEAARAELEAGAARFSTRIAGADLGPLSLDWGGVEVALVFSAHRADDTADRDLLGIVVGAVQGFSSGNLWYETRGIGEDAAPRIQDNGWEALVIRHGGFIEVIDFMRAEGRGAFYQRRLHATDSIATQRRANPGITLDPRLVIQDVAETISAGLNLGGQLGFDPATTTASFAFRWSGLRNRRLVDLAGELLILPGQYRSHQDVETGDVDVPLTTAPLAVAPAARTATRRLFAAFDGFGMTLDQAQARVRARLEGRS